MVCYPVFRRHQAVSIAYQPYHPATPVPPGVRSFANASVQNDPRTSRTRSRRSIGYPKGGKTPAQPAAHGFADHLREAIALNRSRRAFYAKQTGGRSLLLSTTLITLEHLSLPWAIFLDRKARPFTEKGIAVVGGDFIPLHGLPPAHTPPRFRRIAAPAHVDALKAALRAYKTEVNSALSREDLLGVAQASYALLETISRVEESAQAHFAMTRHVAESVGQAALNGSRYALASDGETTRLSIRLIRGQLTAFTSSPWLDRRAQAQHVRGVGILVNDLPHIPFEAQWEQHTRSKQRQAFRRLTE